MKGRASVTATVHEPELLVLDEPMSGSTTLFGVGLARLNDFDGDGKTDIVLADKNTIQWYQNPSWTKHVIAENLTKRDNVCITARDINGDEWVRVTAKSPPKTTIKDDYVMVASIDFGTTFSGYACSLKRQEIKITKNFS